MSSAPDTQPSLIQQALARGDPDEQIVERIMEETAVTEEDAWMVLGWEKGDDMSDVQLAEPA